MIIRARYVTPSAVQLIVNIYLRMDPDNQFVSPY